VRWLTRAILLVVVGASVYDVTRPPGRQFTARLAVAGIHLYQARISPHVGAAGAICRFDPTCSRYAEVVIARDGTLRGGWRALKRIARCGPWTRPGTKDPP
jgi:hypothetical protein